VFLFPFAAPSTAGFVGNSPKGRGMDAARQQEGRKPSLLTPDKTEERKEEAVTGRLFFGYFLLAEQKKVARCRVREPD